ncbi:MAG: phosphoglycerate mutase family protein, partial [Pseudomonadales bacterium]|nr:phosphoglycerate mutase family protein [Pseudomonadales bacterium]
DAPLVDKGILQAKELGKKWDNLDKIQKVLVSPLTRTLQTAENIFKDRVLTQGNRCDFICVKAMITT